MNVRVIREPWTGGSSAFRVVDDVLVIIIPPEIGDDEVERLVNLAREMVESAQRRVIEQWRRLPAPRGKASP